MTAGDTEGETTLEDGLVVRRALTYERAAQSEHLLLAPGNPPTLTWHDLPGGRGPTWVLAYVDSLGLVQQLSIMARHPEEERLAVAEAREWLEALPHDEVHGWRPTPAPLPPFRGFQPPV